ncbi:MAG: VTT domain-containing protein [Desulfobacterales bacterium]|nr:VTT domain-containing protein [Desulfobacterales bacterium]
MSLHPKYTKILIGLIIILGLALLSVLLYRDAIAHLIGDLYAFITNREKVSQFIASFGFHAPLVFIGLQILQVILAPFPGEATGFIGGFLFGASQGFLYSSIGLTVGSWLNFLIGRLLGQHYIRKVIPAARLQKMDQLMKRQGVLVVFLLFVFPGFPKDYLCLFLGITAIPIKVFLLLSAFGRMPGTFMLSLQGASLFEKNYTLFVAITIICAMVVFVGYRYREKIYTWIDKMNSR